MSKYTTQVKNIIESGVNLFDFSYPIWNESYRSSLESKIINHYYFREIGFETVGQFKWFLQSKMNRIMPYYNQLYQTENLVNGTNFSENLNVTEETQRLGTNETQGKTSSQTMSTQDEKNNQVFQDTPMSKVGNEDYATNITDNHNEAIEDVKNDSNSNVTNQVNEHLLTNRKGNTGEFLPDLVTKWRQTLLNIDQMVIEELNELFLNVY